MYKHMVNVFEYHENLQREDKLRHVFPQRNINDVYRSILCKNVTRIELINNRGEVLRLRKDEDNNFYVNLEWSCYYIIKDHLLDSEDVKNYIFRLDVETIKIEITNK